MNSKFFMLWALLGLTLFTLSESKGIRVDTNTRQLIDEFNRTKLYHGVNVVYKVAPFYPITDHFHTNDSLAEEDLQNFQEWGFNFIRLFIAWEAFEPQRSVYNYTYFEKVRDVVRLAAKYNVSVLLDMHQDLLNRQFCGEGLPDWAVVKESFPDPVEVDLEYGPDGYPTIESCLKKSFANYYLSYDVGKSFDNLYRNVNGIGDAFGEFWRRVADYFKDEENVMGYELINEPWFGDVYNDWWAGLSDGYANKYYMQPFYRKLHEYIRSVDNETLIFFDASPFDSIGLGFTEGPGGPEYNDRQVLSYHIYCGTNDAVGDPVNPTICYIADTVSNYVHLKAAESLGIGSFLTEFGAYTNSTKAINEIDWVTNYADERFQSWAYWQFKWYADFTTSSGVLEGFYDNDGNLQSNKAEIMSRPYFSSTCGVPKSYKFDRKTKSFSYSFVFNGCTTGVSEFYLPRMSGGEWTIESDEVLVERIDKTHYKASALPQVQVGDIINIKAII